jgi:hypothetical protein
MWKSIIYKEWLKTRWLLLASLSLGILVMVYIFLQVRHGMQFVGAVEFWNSILFKGYNFVKIVKYIPLIMGLGLAVAQYFPETLNKRIKLTFHLPKDETRLLLGIHAYGVACLIALFLIFYLVFIAGSIIYFPREITNSTLVTALPWFLGGLAAHFMAALILLEPVWRYRFFYALVGYGFVSLFYVNAGLGAYAPAIPSLLVLTVLSSVVVLFSGYRFRKGEM